jgi:hypothetical protein
VTGSGAGSGAAGGGVGSAHESPYESFGGAGDDSIDESCDEGHTTHTTHTRVLRGAVIAEPASVGHAQPPYAQSHHPSYNQPPYGQPSYSQPPSLYDVRRHDHTTAGRTVGSPHGPGSPGVSDKLAAKLAMTDVVSGVVQGVVSGVVQGVVSGVVAGLAAHGLVKTNNFNDPYAGEEGAQATMDGSSAGVVDPPEQATMVQVVMAEPWVQRVTLERLPDECALVQWSKGKRCFYPIGLNGAHGLSVAPEPEAPALDRDSHRKDELGQLEGVVAEEGAVAEERIVADAAPYIAPLSEPVGGPSAVPVRQEVVAVTCTECASDDAVEPMRRCDGCRDSLSLELLHQVVRCAGSCAAARQPPELTTHRPQLRAAPRTWVW